MADLELREYREWHEQMNSIKNKIKPCLCGSVPSLVYEKVGHYDDRLYFFIHCKKCSIKMEGIPHSSFLTNEEKMKFAEKTVEKWNAWNKMATGRLVTKNLERFLQTFQEVKNTFCSHRECGHFSCTACINGCSGEECAFEAVEDAIYELKEMKSK